MQSLIEAVNQEFKGDMDLTKSNVLGGVNTDVFKKFGL
jgi:hypothetical protein